MSSRLHILNRIRTALNSAAPYPDDPGDGALFQPIPASHLVAHFERELTALKGEFYCVHNWQDAQDWIKSVIDKNELRRIAIAPDEDVVEVSRPVNPYLLSGTDDCGKALADVDLGITGCECLVARTGSIVLTTHSGFGRVLSVLPPAHMVVARRSQLFADLDDAYHLLQTRYHRSWPSMMTIITGPSRTADIEKALVLGAHGPKKLFVLLLDF